MPLALVDIANNAAGKMGGFGDQLTGEAFVTAAQLAANTDKVSQWINIKYPRVRQKVIADFAAMGCPFPETRKFADLGKDLKQYDIAISTIAVASTVVTITTAEAHGRATSDTVYLTDIKQDDDEDIDDIEQTLITSLNGNTETVTVVDSTSFTIATVGVDLTWVHEEGTGIVSYVPEIGQWQYAFQLPSDYFVMVRQCDETTTAKTGVRRKYPYQPILNRDGDGHILLSNDLTNADTDGAYIEYCIDQTDFTLFSPAFIECIATLLAAELCPCLNRNPEERVKLLMEYDRLTEPNAKEFNQSQYNNRAKSIPDFSGGRTSGGALVGRASDLGTYIDAAGNRKSV